MQKEKISRKNKGITLIALIITIIVMLILVGVSVNVALNGELFSTAKQASAITELEAEKERLLEIVMGTLNDKGKVDANKLETAINASEDFEMVDKEEQICKGLKTGTLYKVGTYGNITIQEETNDEETTECVHEYEAQGEDIHACILCGNEEEHNIDFDNLEYQCEGHCDVCDYDPPCSDDDLEYDEYDHWCKGCGNSGEHSWTTADGKHTCYCGYSEDCYNDDYGGIICSETCDICGAEGPHDWIQDSESDHTCSECGEGEEHKWIPDEEGHKCEVCGYIDDSCEKCANSACDLCGRYGDECIGECEEPCEICGEIIDHNWADTGTGDHECDRCNFATSHILDSNGICTVCGYDENE